MEYFLIWVGLAVLVGFAGTNRKGGFGRAFLRGFFLSPIVALIFIIGGARKNAKGCNQCGNKYNEAEYCGLCGKNDEGRTKEEVEKLHTSQNKRD